LLRVLLIRIGALSAGPGGRDVDLLSDLNRIAWRA
jgi:hypothetical protein